MRGETIKVAESRPGMPRLAWLPILLVVCLTMISSRSNSLIRTQNLEPVVLILAWLLYMSKFRFPKLALRGPVWLFLLLVVGLIATLWGILAHDSLVNARTLLKQLRDPLLGMAAFITIVGVNHMLPWKNLLRSTLVTFCVSAGMVALAIYVPGLNGFAAWVQQYEGRGITAGFEGPNSLGAAVSLLMPWAIAYAFEAKSVSSKLYVGSLSVLLLFILVLTQSRGAFLSTVLGLAVMMGVFLSTHVPKRKWVTLVVLIAFAVGAAFTMGEETLVDRVFRTEWSSLDQDLTTVRRVLLLRAATSLFAERPVLGHGLGGFEAEVQRFIGASMEASTTPHNTVLFVAAQMGVVGLFILMGFYLWMLKSSLRFFQFHRNHWGAAALASTAAILMNEMFFPYVFTHDTGLLIWMILAVMVGGYCERLRGTQNDTVH